MLEIIFDTLIDTARLVPFLFLSFLVIELLEHKLSNKTNNILLKSGKLGPLLGSLFGLIPQCGFSVVATNLYITRIISLGTLIAIYLSTSDEMLPILLSEKAPFKEIALILVIKFVVAVIAGYIINIFLKKNKEEHEHYDICHEEHCGCEHEHHLIQSSMIHTVKTLVYLLLITFIINVIFNYVGSPYLSKIFLKDSLFGPFITGLIGLIPSCGSSIMLTELYLKGAINLSSVISGLLTGSGIALLILFKSNKNLKENITILSIIYLTGVLTGIIIQLLMSIF